MKDGISFCEGGRIDGEEVTVVDANGKTVLEQRLAGSVSEPAIGPDGIAYFNHGDIGLVGIDKRGTVRTALKLWEKTPDPMLAFPPAFSVDGNVYLALSWSDRVSEAAEMFVAVREGKVVWKNTEPPNSYRRPPVIGADGKVFVADGTGLKAISADGTVQWTVDLRFGQMDYGTDPIVMGSGGTVYAPLVQGDNYVLDYRLFAITDEGIKKWETGFKEMPPTEGLLKTNVDSRGNVLFAAALDSAVHKSEAAMLFVLDNSGQVVAKRTIEGFRLDSHPVLLSDGAILIGGNRPYQIGENYLSDATLYRLDARLNTIEEHSWKSQRQAGAIKQVGFGNCGEMYMLAARMNGPEGDDRTCLYKIKVSPGLGIADAPWPLERGDMARTGRVNVR
jgi:outer membrane protein assembly factor BamB